MGKRTRSGYTEFAAARFVGPDDIRALARALREKADTATGEATCLVLLRDADFFERLADLKEKIPGIPRGDDL
jgi:hypothetical protein